MLKKTTDKKGESDESSFLIWLLIGLGVLVIGTLLAIGAHSKGLNLIDYAKSFFRIGV
jgi:hypothetical protein